MNICYGSAWRAFSEADLFLIESHSTITKDGNYLMGSISEREANARYPALSGSIAKMVMSVSGHVEEGGGSTVYPPHYFVVSPRWPKKKMGFIQVRKGGRTNLDWDIIEESVSRLKEWCKDHEDAKVHMPYIGGGLSIEFIDPLLRSLPDNVTCWMRSNWKPSLPPALPEGHRYYPALSTLDGDWMAYGFSSFGFQFEEALNAMYKSITTDQSGRLNQYLAIEAYLTNGKDLRGAYETGRNIYNKLMEDYPANE